MTSFEKLYNELLAIPWVYHFNLDLPTKLETDALDRVIARVYSQEHADGL